MRYIPTFDVAQYALHQGDVRSANLIEGLIPLYQSALDTLSFMDIRFYNPNGTPLEGNIDLGLRKLFQISSNSGTSGAEAISIGSTTAVNISGDFKNNRFLMSNNNSTNYGVAIRSSIDFDNPVRQNTVEITDNIGVDNAGFYVDVNTGEIVNFDKAITGNNIIINGSSSGNYGFNLNTNSGNGTINFENNSSPTELSSSNSNAAVIPSTSTPGDGINYNGYS